MKIFVHWGKINIQKNTSLFTKIHKHIPTNTHTHTHTHTHTNTHKKLSLAQLQILTDPDNV